MSTSRTLHWWETQYNVGKIIENNWQFQIAKSVAAGSLPATSNVIWQSQGIAPETTIAWDVDYALNWTATLPPSGARVAITGKWQPCAKGQVFDIGKDGFFTPSAEKPIDGWMKVGKVDYKYPGVDGIHIVVGVKNTITGKYDAVYIDPTELPPGSSAKYQPQENITWWLEGGSKNGQVYSSTRGSIGGQDYSNPAPKTNQYEWWTTFTFSDGLWANSQYEPDSRLLAPPLSEPLLYEVDHYPIVGIVSFAIAIAAAHQAGVTSYLQNILLSTFTDVKVEFGLANGKELKISYGPRISAKSGSIEEIGVLVVGGVGPTVPIEDALKTALVDGVLPTAETWTIEMVS
jgi:hypothetical protein